MAITKLTSEELKKAIGNQDETKIGLIVENGDLEALKKIQDLYKLVDESSVIIYAIGVLSQSNGTGVTIQKEDGSSVKLIPSAKLKIVE